MSEKDNGGPAFPKAALDAWGKTTVMDKGMTLRDYFAAKAMQALIQRYEGVDFCMETISGDAYLYAEAMLEARK